MAERLQTLDDAELVILARDGHLAAFNCLVGRWEGSLYAFARRMLGDSEEARDVCQEALVRVWTHLGRLREPDRFRPWAHHIVLNLCRDRHRSRRSRGRAEEYIEGEPAELRLVENVRTPGSPAADAHVAGLGEAVEKALGSLPAEQRAAILLREYHGFTAEEIATMSGVPAATVRTRIFYGLRSVRRTLAARGITASGLG